MKSKFLPLVVVFIIVVGFIFLRNNQTNNLDVDEVNDVLDNNQDSKLINDENNKLNGDLTNETTEIKTDGSNIALGGAKCDWYPDTEMADQDYCLFNFCTQASMADSLIKLGDENVEKCFKEVYEPCMQACSNDGEDREEINADCNTQIAQCLN